THRFLLALEASGSTGGKTGWLPKPLILSEAGRPAALMPLWLKTHSQGEYIFDHGWAEAYERAGGRYYPKLQAAVPFTPVTGRRFLGPDHHLKTLAGAAISITGGNQISSLHVTFCTEGEAQALAGFQDLIARKSQQFH